jgi:hypothetical protein
LLDDGTIVVVMRAIVHIGDLVNDFAARCSPRLWRNHEALNEGTTFK